MSSSRLAANHSLGFLLWCSICPAEALLGSILVL